MRRAGVRIVAMRELGSYDVAEGIDPRSTRAANSVAPARASAPTAASR
jgi:hypothetical protein